MAEDDPPYDKNIFVPLPFGTEERNGGFWKRLRRSATRPRICRQSAAHNITAILPIFHWLRNYDVRKDFLKDFIAGLTVGTLAVPQALGYAIVAGVNPIFGLYTCFIPPLIYSLMGTSRHASIGVFALVCLMTGEVLTDVLERQNHRTGTLRESNLTDSLGGNQSVELLLSPSQIASTLAFAVGLWQVLLGIFGLGFLTVYLSDRVVQGFACGAAFHIFHTQLKWIFGLALRKRRGLFSLPLGIWDFLVMLPYIHMPTCLVSVACLVALIVAKLINGQPKVMKIIRFPVPMELLVIIFGSIASYCMDLHNIHRVDIIRTVPLGLPTPQLPAFRLLPEMASDAFLIGVIAFSAGISASRVFAQKHHYTVDSNQELRALGMANLFSSFFQCIPSGVALARSMVQEAAGGVTQVVSIVAASLIVLVITVLGPLLEPVPKACLGNIVVVALSPTILRITEVAHLWKISKLEAAIFLVPCVAIILMDVEIGLAIGVIFSLFAGAVIRTQLGRVELLGRTRKNMHPAVEGDSREIFSTVKSIPNVTVLRICTPLYFANAEICLNKVRKLLRRDRHRSARPLTTSLQSVKATRLSSDGEGTDETLLNQTLELCQKVTLDESREVSHISVAPKCGNVASNGKCDVSVPVSLPFTSVIVLDMNPVSFVDMTAVRALKKLEEECQTDQDLAGSRLLFAGCLDSVKEMLVDGGKCGDFPAGVFFGSVCDAVESCW